MLDCYLNKSIIVIAIASTSLVGLSRLPHAVSASVLSKINAALTSLQELYHPGDIVKAKILSVSVASNKISLGLKSSYFNNEDDNEEEVAVDAIDEDLDDDEEVIDEDMDDNGENEEQGDEMVVVDSSEDIETEEKYEEILSNHDDTGSFIASIQDENNSKIYNSAVQHKRPREMSSIDHNEPMTKVNTTAQSAVTLLIDNCFRFWNQRNRKSKKKLRRFILSTIHLLNGMISHRLSCLLRLKW